MNHPPSIRWIGKFGPKHETPDQAFERKLKAGCYNNELHRYYSIIEQSYADKESGQ